MSNNGPDPATGDNPGVMKFSGRATIAALILAELLSSFESGMILAALVVFYKEYQDPAAVGWLITGFMLFATISAAICGRLGDMYGRRTVLLVVITLAALGSVISAIAESLPIIILGRTIQGASGAILPLCYGLVREFFPTARVSYNVGIISGTASAGGLIGVVAGGMIVDFWHWRGIFVMSGVLAVLAFVAIWFVLPEGRRRGGEPLDFLGALLFCVAIGLALYTIGLGDGDDLGSPTQLAFGAVSVIAIAAWTLWELRCATPMIDVRLLASRQMGLTLVVLLLGSAGAMNIQKALFVMMQQPVSTGVGLGLSGTVASLVGTPSLICGIIASPITGWLAGRYDAKWAMTGAMALFSVAWLGLLMDHGSVVPIVGWMMLNGTGIGALLAAAPAIIVAAAPANRASEAAGGAQVIRKIGMALGAQWVAVTLASSTIRVEGGNYPAPDAYGVIFVSVAGISLLGLLLSLRLPAKPSPEPVSESQLQR